MDDSDAKKFLASFKGKKTSVTLWCYSQTSDKLEVELNFSGCFSLILYLNVCQICNISC